MTDTPQENRLIAALPRADRARLLAACTLVDLEFGQPLARTGEAHAYAWFPVTGYISLLATVQDHPPLEMALIGNEGMLGATLVLGVDRVPLVALVQGSGTALRIGVRSFRRCLKESPALERSLLRYLYVTTAQLAQTAACTRFHEVNQRLARWLLMSLDRSDDDVLQLTHQFLADMLGVRRSAVTIAAGQLQDRGVISYQRGHIEVLDRPGLLAASCECYAAVQDLYAQQLG